MILENMWEWREGYKWMYVHKIYINNLISKKDYKKNNLNFCIL